MGDSIADRRLLQCSSLSKNSFRLTSEATLMFIVQTSAKSSSKVEQDRTLIFNDRIMFKGIDFKMFKKKAEI
jgi:hypothetical protein